MWRRKLLDSFLGEEGRVLVHIDEHKKLSKDPRLRKAAIEFISEDPRVLMIATFTEPLWEDSEEMCSSGSAKKGIAKPLPDLKDILTVKFGLQLAQLEKVLDDESKAKRIWKSLQLLVFMTTAFKGYGWLQGKRHSCKHCLPELWNLANT